MTEKGKLLLVGYNRQECFKVFENLLKLDPTNSFYHWAIAYSHCADYNMNGPVYDLLKQTKDWPSYESAYYHCEKALEYMSDRNDEWKTIYKATKVRLEEGLEKYADYLDTNLIDSDNCDVLCVKAESRMLLQPWKLWDRKTMKKTENADYVEMILNKGLQLNPTHEWLCHLKIHYCEMGPPEQFDMAVLEPLTRSRTRLAYDELLANQLALALIRRALRKLPGSKISGKGQLRGRVIENLPFQLTTAQESAITEITNDMATNGRMLRLLQGDVGSGKTVVALFAALNAIETGGQVAIMAPTEILARQHFETLSQLLKDTGITLGILTGRDRGAGRKKTMNALEDGTLNLIVGTHALFQKDVIFSNLLLVVIDEQHRFGVHQRLTLAEKGRGVDTLVMTATPIPRTLLLTAYGDLDCSRLLGKPPGREPVDTRTISNDRLGEVVASIGRAIKTGAKIYWVCPLVEESETIDLANAEARFAALKKQFGDEVELIHGRMKGPEKDAAMSRFSSGTANILVATTVIEVGVDVPEASIMVIEHAERFGLAQLHQLRGRIGRGDQRSTCLLVYASPLTETARARLKMMRETDDGFLIAEEDLRLRGGGEILGTRQSGIPDFRLADLSSHADLLTIAQGDAKIILEMDPELKSERGEALRTLLYLFERDEAVAYLRSG